MPLRPTSLHRLRPSPVKPPCFAAASRWTLLRCRAGYQLQQQRGRHDEVARKNHYERLNVRHDATPAEIKKCVLIKHNENPFPNSTSDPSTPSPKLTIPTPIPPTQTPRTPSPSSPSPTPSSPTQPAAQPTTATSSACTMGIIMLTGITTPEPHTTPPTQPVAARPRA